MIFFNCIVLCSLFWNIKQFTHVKNISEKLTDQHFPITLTVNFGLLAAGAIGYGRPYLPSIISFAGLLIIGIGLRDYPGLIKCTEALFTLLSIYSLILEYLCIGYGYWSYAEEKNFFVRWIIIFIITFFISIYHFCNSQLVS